MEERTGGQTRRQTTVTQSATCERGNGDERPLRIKRIKLFCNLFSPSLALHSPLASASSSDAGSDWNLRRQRCRAHPATRKEHRGRKGGPQLHFVSRRYGDSCTTLTVLCSMTFVREGPGTGSHAPLGGQTAALLA